MPFVAAQAAGRQSLLETGRETVGQLNQRGSLLEREELQLVEAVDNLLTTCARLTPNLDELPEALGEIAGRRHSAPTYVFTRQKERARRGSYPKPRMNLASSDIFSGDHGGSNVSSLWTLSTPGISWTTRSMSSWII